MSLGPDIVTRGLVLTLDAADKRSYPGTGTTWFDLVNSNNGTLTNGPIFNSGNGGYFGFDGTDDFVAVSNLGLSSNTIEGWFNSADNTQGGSSGGTIVSIFGNYTPNAGAVGKYTYIGVIPNLTFRIDDGVNSHVGIATVSYSANIWYNVAITYNASNGAAKAYVNGEEVGVNNFTEDITFDSVDYDIAKSVNGNCFNGDVALTKVYNRALSAVEIKQNYNAVKNRFGL